jgi:AcrR family transcriptional regulator
MAGGSRGVKRVRYSGPMAKPRTPRVQQKPAGEYHHGNLRRALLDATLQMIDEQGPDAFSLREVTRRVGVDHRAAYKHFEDRATLLVELSLEGFAALGVELETELGSTAEPEASARLTAIARATLRFAVQRPALYRLMTGPRLNADGRFPALEAALRIRMDRMRGEIQNGVDRGEFMALDTLEASIAFWAALSGLCSLVVSGRVRLRGDKLAAYAARSLGFTLRGFRA